MGQERGPHRLVAESSTVSRLRWASSVTTWIDGYSLTVVSGLLFAIHDSLGTTAFQGTLLIAAVLIGALVGGLVTGFVADRIGRRAVFAYDLLGFAVFSILSAVAPDFGSLLTARILLGVSIGADYAISPGFLAEMSPAGRRGWDLGFIWVLWNVGALMSLALSAVALAVLPAHVVWRLILALPVLPAVIGLVLRQTIPESPRWLAARGEAAASAESVARYGLERFRISGEATLSPRDARRRWVYALGPWFFLAFMGYGVGLLLPYILSLSGASSTSAALWAGAGVLFVGAAGMVAGMYMVDDMGRKRLQVGGFVLSGLLLAVMGVLDLGRAIPYVLLVVLFMLTNAVYQGGPSITVGVYPAELFPTAQRATVLGVATAVSRLGAAIGVVVMGSTIATGGLSPVVFMGAFAALCGFALTAIFGMETKRRTLEELVATSADA